MNIDPNNKPGSAGEPEEMTEEQVLAAMFSNLVVQQTRTALYTLGQIPDPETGRRIVDLNTAQMLIATLEMLQAKTKGNLSEKEDQLITKSIEQLHEVFDHTIRVIEKAQAEKGGTTEGGLFTPPSGIVTPNGSPTVTPTTSTTPVVSASDLTGSEATPPIAQEPPPPPPPSKGDDDEDSRKRFSKKY